MFHLPKLLVLLSLLLLLAPATIVAQEEPVQPDEATASETAEPDAEEASDKPPTEDEDTDITETVEEAAEDAAENVSEHASNLAETAQKKVEDVAEDIDKSETAKDVSAGVLTPIYQLAEAMEFSAFHWIAFALMITGVISYALQLVIGKLVVLAHAGFSIQEILSDALGLVISLIGLVLTTQAAAQNSSFTQSPFAVLSSALLGIVLGIVFFFWGQSAEVQAAKGRTAQNAEERAAE